VVVLPGPVAAGAVPGLKNPAGLGVKTAEPVGPGDVGTERRSALPIVRIAGFASIAGVTGIAGVAART